jgi:hypothetical protein
MVGKSVLDTSLLAKSLGRLPNEPQKKRSAGLVLQSLRKCVFLSSGRGGSFHYFNHHPFCQYSSRKSLPERLSLPMPTNVEHSHVRISPKRLLDPTISISSSISYPEKIYPFQEDPPIRLFLRLVLQPRMGLTVVPPSPPPPLLLLPPRQRQRV